MNSKIKSDLVYLSFGSNIPPCIYNITKGVDYLELNGISLIEMSNMIVTKAFVCNETPKAYLNNNHFVNAVGSFKCDFNYYTPQKLLELVKLTEQVIGRIERGRWAARELDIDILFYSREEINEENLIIPHKDFINREFLHSLLNQIIK